MKANKYVLYMTYGETISFKPMEVQTVSLKEWVKITYQLSRVTKVHPSTH